MAVDAISTATPVRERLSFWLYLASLYFIVVGALHLWGYWSTFGIDIMPYVGLGDVIKLTIVPVVSAFASIAAGAVASLIWPLIPRSMFPPGGGRDTPEGRFLNRFLPLLLALYLLPTVALLLFGPVLKWFVLPWMWALPVSVAEQRHGLFRSLWPNETARSTVVFLLTALLIFGYGYGRIKAAAVVDGRDYSYLAADTVEGVHVGNESDPKTRVKYLGQVGDYVFLLLPDNTTWAVTRFDKTRGLELRHFRAR